MTSAILYSSLSGNTKLLAETIYDVIKEDCKYCGETKEIDADRVYIGFWTNKGTADDKTMEFLKLFTIKKYSYLERLGLEEAKNILMVYYKELNKI